MAVMIAWDDGCLESFLFPCPSPQHQQSVRPDFSWQSVLTPNTVNNRKERLSPTHLRFPDVPPGLHLYSTWYQLHCSPLDQIPTYEIINGSTNLTRYIGKHPSLAWTNFLAAAKSVIPSWFFCQTFSGQWPGYIRRWTGNTTGKFPSGFDFCRWVQELPWRTGLLSLPGHLPLLPENPGLTNL